VLAQSLTAALGLTAGLLLVLSLQTILLAGLELNNISNVYLLSICTCASGFAVILNWLWQKNHLKKVAYACAFAQVLFAAAGAFTGNVTLIYTLLFLCVMSSSVSMSFLSGWIHERFPLTHQFRVISISRAIVASSALAMLIFLEPQAIHYSGVSLIKTMLAATACGGLVFLLAAIPLQLRRMSARRSREITSA